MVKLMNYDFFKNMLSVHQQEYINEQAKITSPAQARTNEFVSSLSQITFAFFGIF